MGLTPSVPSVPKEVSQAYQVNLDKLLPAALQADVDSYNRSDADFAARFPGIVAGQKAAFDSASQDVQSPSPLAVGQFVDTGLERAFNSGLGNVNEGAIQGAGRNAVAASVANSAQAFQDTARQNLSDLFQPERGIGLSPDEIMNLQFGNTDAMNKAIQQKKAADFQHAQSQSAADAAGTQSLIGIGTSVLSAL